VGEALNITTSTADPAALNCWYSIVGG
jgi:hypothetical protein